MASKYPSLIPRRTGIVIPHWEIFMQSYIAPCPSLAFSEKPNLIAMPPRASISLFDRYSAEVGEK
jgi:hypothetical protein